MTCRHSYACTGVTSLRSDTGGDTHSLLALFTHRPSTLPSQVETHDTHSLLAAVGRLTIAFSMMHSVQPLGGVRPQLPNPHSSISISTGPNRGATSCVAARNESLQAGPAAQRSLRRRARKGTGVIGLSVQGCSLHAEDPDGRAASHLISISDTLGHLAPNAIRTLQPPYIASPAWPTLT